MTKATSFIRPLLNIPKNVLDKNGVKETYLGHFDKTGDVWGEKVYMTFDRDTLSIDLMQYMRNKDSYITDAVDSNLHIFEFSISDSDKEKIIKPFLQGEYSKIDRTYVDEKFPQLIYSNGVTSISAKWKVLHKDSSLARYWEERIGTKFNEHMEVWSRPTKEEEIYGFTGSKTQSTVGIPTESNESSKSLGSQRGTQTDESAGVNI